MLERWLKVSTGTEMQTFLGELSSILQFIGGHNWAGERSMKHNFSV